ncbi:ABC transporter permease [Microbispora siamensis]|uniref:ABC transporter permease n=1 Tax=Microbispora siamensis TaxID=564413 RepID=UPI0019510326|nr:ABC transporter permease [Microbispora siamensis]
MLRGGGRLAATVALAIIVIFVLLAMSADDPAAALGSLLSGPFTSSFRTGQWLSDSANLMLSGAAVAMVFRAGQFSLGAEGQILVGALAAGAAVLHLPSFPGVFVVGLTLGALAGFLFGLVPGLMKAYGGSDEIVSTLMLNYVATYGFALLINRYLQPASAGYPVSDFFDPAAFLPSLRIGQLTIGLALPFAIGCCVAVWYLINWTKTGFEMGAVGASVPFAQATGMRVRRSVWLSMALSGLIAGLAGAVIAEGSTHRLIVGLSANIGFDGILVALLTANRPLLIPLAAVAYGYIRTGGDIAQLSSGIPREVITTLQGFLILAVTARAPLAWIRHRAGRRRPAHGGPVIPGPAPLRAAASSQRTGS